MIHPFISICVLILLFLEPVGWRNVGFCVSTFSCFLPKMWRWKQTSTVSLSLCLLLKCFLLKVLNGVKIRLSFSFISDLMSSFYFSALTVADWWATFGCKFQIEGFKVLNSCYFLWSKQGRGAESWLAVTTVTTCFSWHRSVFRHDPFLLELCFFGSFFLFYQSGACCLFFFYYTLKRNSAKNAGSLSSLLFLQAKFTQDWRRDEGSFFISEVSLWDLRILMSNLPFICKILQNPVSV